MTKSSNDASAKTSGPGRRGLPRRTRLLADGVTFVVAFFTWLLIGGTPAGAPRQGEEGRSVRGIFLETRPDNSSGGASKSPAGPERLAFGYTLFLYQPGQSTRVSPDRMFRSGERVRLLVETNRNAYVYVLHQEGDGPAHLLFPAASLQNGENRVKAHQSSLIPFEGWFVFDEHPAAERLTIVVSEESMVGIPRGSELSAGTSFQLSPDAAARLREGAQPTVTEAEPDKNAVMSSAEGRRGIFLSGGDPPPSRVVMKKTPRKGWVIAQLSLIHR